jgi:hypothetical protein
MATGLAEKGFEDKSKKICNCFFEQLVIWSCSNAKSVYSQYSYADDSTHVNFLLLGMRIYCWLCVAIKELCVTDGNRQH